VAAFEGHDVRPVRPGNEAFVYGGPVEIRYHATSAITLVTIG
jgi:hypothetical protein